MLLLGGARWDVPWTGCEGCCGRWPFGVKRNSKRDPGVELGFFPHACRAGQSLLTVMLFALARAGIVELCMARGIRCRLTFNPSPSMECRTRRTDVWSTKWTRTLQGRQVHGKLLEVGAIMAPVQLTALNKKRALRVLAFLLKTSVLHCLGLF